MGLVASSLSDLSVKCAEWEGPDSYITDSGLQGVRLLAADVIKDTANMILHFLMELNIYSMTADILLAARNTKRPFVYACTRLIDKNINLPFYEKMCVENIIPLARAIQPLGARFDWIPHIAYVLTAVGIKSAETLGKGVPENTLKEYLVWVVAEAPLEVRTTTMAGIFNFINDVRGDAGAVWLIEVFEGIGVEYNRRRQNFPPQEVITYLGVIGSSLSLEGKLFTVELPRKALESIEVVLRSGGDERLAGYACKAVLRIMTETDDKESKEKALGIFGQSSKGIEKPTFRQRVDNCIDEFKAENRADLRASDERRLRLERFISDLYRSIS